MNSKENSLNIATFCTSINIQTKYQAMVLSFLEKLAQMFLS